MLRWGADKGTLGVGKYPLVVARGQQGSPWIGLPSDRETTLKRPLTLRKASKHDASHPAYILTARSPRV